MHANPPALADLTPKSTENHRELKAENNRIPLQINTLRVFGQALARLICERTEGGRRRRAKDDVLATGIQGVAGCAARRTAEATELAIRAWREASQDRLHRDRVMLSPPLEIPVPVG